MKHWIWTHPKPDETFDDWRRQFSRVRAAGVEAVLACLYNGRHAGFPSQVVPTGSPVIEGLLTAAREEDIELHAWMIALRCNVEPVQSDHPDWYSISRAGASSLDEPPYIPSYQWLCPSRPEVRQYVQDLVAELAGYSELSGIHLDYIRHPDVILPVALQPKYGLKQDREFAEFDFCYCSVCRQEFQRQSGSDPADLKEPESDLAWRGFRENAVRALAQAVRERVRPAGKTFSAAVFATPELARRYVRQSWDTWDLDAVFPMIYHGFYGQTVDWIEVATREGVSALAGRRPLFAGIYIPALPPHDIARAVEAAVAGGAAGISVFSQASLQDEHWGALEDALQG